MKRWDIIQKFIDKYNYTSYLEIGFQRGVNYERINCKEKYACDPDPVLKGVISHPMTSDDFFKSWDNSKKIDIIFIDGLHESEQIYKDIVNSLSILNDNGTIICHDMNPTSEEMQKVPRETKVWTGDGWKAWLRIRQNRDDLYTVTVNTDFGCGIIRKGYQEKLKLEAYNYNEFSKQRGLILNLISPGDFSAMMS